MKYIKLFENLKIDKIAIDLRNATLEKQIKGLDILEKYIRIEDWQRMVLNLKEKGYLPAQYWIINLETNKFDWINTPNYNLIKSGIDLNNVITLDEFLEIGFENIVEYIETKNAANKYNL